MNGLNQYTSAGGLAFGYDANGNLTGDSRSSYLYDVENRLVSVSGASAATLRYDPLGRLYEVAGGGGATRFLYDGDALVGEYDAASGALLRRYVHGSDAKVDDPLFWYEGPGLADRRGLHADHQGSVMAVSTAAGGMPNSYDEWGIPGAANQGRFQYTGQAWLPEIGMYHYKARIYSPTLGRFLQTDPVGYDDQINLYAYVANDPVNLVDSNGQESIHYSTNGRGPDIPAPSLSTIGSAVFVAAVALDIANTPVLPGPDISMAGAAAMGALSKAEIKATTPYSRPSGATTPAQRASVQGKPCVKCGETTSTQRAGHKEALVKEHYEKGSIDKDRMRSKDAVQPECPTCSNRERAEMSRYSREMRKRLDEQ